MGVQQKTDVHSFSHFVDVFFDSNGDINNARDVSNVLARQCFIYIRSLCRCSTWISDNKVGSSEDN